MVQEVIDWREFLRRPPRWVVTSGGYWGSAARRMPTSRGSREQHYDTWSLCSRLYSTSSEDDGGMVNLPFEKLWYPFAGGMNANDLAEAVIGEDREDDVDALHIAQEELEQRQG